MLNFCSLYSGSSGNSLFVQSENTKIPFSPYSVFGITIKKNAETSLVFGAVFNICNAGLNVSAVE